MNYSPTIIILAADPEPTLRSLGQCIQAIRAQSYEHWRLCFFVESACDRQIRDRLLAYERDDERIVPLLVEKLPGVSLNHDVGLELPDGDFVALLGSYDSLAPNALLEVARLLNEDSELDLIYTDEDELDLDGLRRRQPWFKPDWSPEMLLSANYLHPMFVRREVFTQADDLPLPFGEAELWHSALVCASRAAKIAHIPKVLCHVRQEVGDRSESRGSQLRASETQASVVAAQMRRAGFREAEATITLRGAIRLQWQTKAPLVSLVIPTRNNPVRLRKCLESILEITRYSRFEVILVDNGNGDQRRPSYFKQLEADSRFHVVPYGDPFNYSEANNLGAGKAKGEHLLFLNDDVEVIEEDWLEEMVRWAESPEIGVVGAKLLFPHHSIQHAGVIVGLGGHAGHVFYGAKEGASGPFGSTEWYRNYMAVTGACMLMPRQTFDAVGGFDERYQLAFGDVDICLRIRKRGYRIVFTPFARLIHHEGSTRGRYIPSGDMVLAYQEFLPYLDSGDPYYNPNLSYASTDSGFSDGRADRVARVEKILEGAKSRSE